MLLLAKLQVKPTLIEEIKSKKPLDITLFPHIKQIEQGKIKDFTSNDKGAFCFQGRFCVPKDEELRQTILREA
ncbi:integrase [Gossypium australe]|uniref:Integrase n=1 Tax=Gossypium australe TaxID=47621 RepID=A0A5B6WQ66_9ROSI|nr:integrase [Gossypium australe]